MMEVLFLRYDNNEYKFKNVNEINKIQNDDKSEKLIIL